MRLLFATIALLAASLGSAIAQPLTCPPVASAAGRPCELFHFHVQMFRPDTRGFIELYGINQFSSQSACDRARDAQFRRNTAVVEFFRTQRRADWWQPDRFGQCHCDMTVEATSPNMLTDSARWGQIQLAEDIRQRVRERLLDAGVASDSELIRGLIPPPIASPLIGGPKLVMMPEPADLSAAPNAPEDLRTTKAVDSAPPMSSLDLPLAEIPLPGMATATEPLAVVAPSPTTPALPTPAVPAPKPVPDPQPAEPSPLPVPSPAPASVPSGDTIAVVADEPDLPAAEDVADAFISYESQRIQNVLKVSGSIGDESVKAQVLDACTQRIQLLSNLRSIIVGSGAKSRLVAAANNAKKESERLDLVSKLFGSDVVPHWAPKDAADVIFDPAISDPEHVLRDTAASDQQRRHALYALLATSSPTEQQQLWLTSLIEALLR
ncbi:MAG: hypothetical protein QOK37_2431 [Thermoanaerobaculia bacterium]|jgi:hypothetical protein|nr:hypothetical protein [Thermoanaerobaculia bacterium]